MNSQQQNAQRWSHKLKTKNRRITEASSAYLTIEGKGDAFQYD
jgi:hypothetical protein